MMTPLDDNQLTPDSNTRFKTVIQRTLKPFLQGHLDAYCGVYCIVNAVHHLRGPLTANQAYELLVKIMRFLESSQPALSRLSDGTRLKEISKVLDHTVIKRHRIHRLKPFKRNKGVTLDQLWRDLSVFLSTHNGIVILGMDGKHGHWSLVKKVTASSLLLFDSDRMHRLSKRHCSVNEEEGRLHILTPTHVTYLWVDGSEGGAK